MQICNRVHASVSTLKDVCLGSFIFLSLRCHIIFIMWNMQFLMPMSMPVDQSFYVMRRSSEHACIPWSKSVLRRSRPEGLQWAAAAAVRSLASSSAPSWRHPPARGCARRAAATAAPAATATAAASAGCPAVAKTPRRCSISRHAHRSVSGGGELCVWHVLPASIHMLLV